MLLFPIFSSQVKPLPYSDIIPFLAFETPTRPVVTETAESSDSDQEATPTVFPGQEMLPPVSIPQRYDYVDMKFYNLIPV